MSQDVDVEGIGQRLREALAGRGLRKLCRDTKMSRRVIQQIMSPPPPDDLRGGRGKRGPTLETVKRLAEGLGVSASWLAFGDEGRRDAA